MGSIFISNDMKVILPCIIYRPIVGFVYSVSISGKIVCLLRK